MFVTAADQEHCCGQLFQALGKFRIQAVDQGKLPLKLYDFRTLGSEALLCLSVYLGSPLGIIAAAEVDLPNPPVLPDGLIQITS